MVRASRRAPSRTAPPALALPVSVVVKSCVSPECRIECCSATHGSWSEAVPTLDKPQLDALIDCAASWADIIAQAMADAPHGFLIYWRSDTTPLMKLAGTSGRCVEYLMGNHTIAERMFRHDPSVMLYAPRARAIHIAGEDHTYFTVDQPSTCFSSSPAIPGYPQP